MLKMSMSVFFASVVRTYKQLKRARVILEFFEEHRVVSNTITLAKVS